MAGPMLRVAVTWEGRLVREAVLRRRGTVWAGEERRCDVILPAGSLPVSWPLFRRGWRGGWSIRQSPDLSGRLVLGGKVQPAGDPDGDPAGASVDLAPGDWGLLRFGGIELFFQCLGATGAAARLRRPSLDARLVASTAASALLLGVVLFASSVLWSPESEAVYKPADRRLMKVELIQPDRPAELVLEPGDEGRRKAAGGEEGVFGDPRNDPKDRSRVPDRAGPLATRIDPSRIGLNAAMKDLRNLDAMTRLMDPSEKAAWNSMAVAMGGADDDLHVGWGSNGMGFKGTGPGGGGPDGPGWLRGRDRIDLPGSPGYRVAVDPGHKKPRTVVTVGSGGDVLGQYCERSAIQRAVLQRAASIRACYERELLLREGLAGSVEVRWTIEADGGVDAAAIARSTLGNRAVEQCVLDTVRRLRFDRPNGGVCVVMWPFVFRPM